MGIMASVIGVWLNLVELVLVWEPFQFGEVYFSDGLKDNLAGCFPLRTQVLMARETWPGLKWRSPTYGGGRCRSPILSSHAFCLLHTARCS